MIASVVSFRGRRGPLRSFRRRHDSFEEETVQIDWSKGLSQNLQDILWHVTRTENVSKGITLAYLNCFTKFCTKLGPNDTSYDTLGFSVDEVFLCLRVVLLHDAVEVRAAGLRAIRYFLRDESTAQSFVRVNIAFLVVRSLDVVLENKIERLQAIRLIRKLLGLNPHSFPPVITRCLVSLARDGLSERDILTRSCWATLSELTLLSPEMSAQSSGVTAILDSILIGSHSPQITEALISCILYLLNDPSLRGYLRQDDQDLQHFASIFTDCYSYPDGQKASGEAYSESNDHRELKFVAARKSMISIIHSWPGLIYLSRYTPDDSQVPNGLQSIIETLHMPYPDIRRHILDLLFELLNLPMPQNCCESFEDALIYFDHPEKRDHESSGHLYNGFVSIEGRNVLPHISRSRVNLLDNYLSILLYSLISYGLIEALTTIIIRHKNFSNSVRATILLGQVLFMSSRLLPPEVSQKCHSLPALVRAATCHNEDSEESRGAEERMTASAAISFLNRMHSVRKSGLKSCSLYLEHLLKCCGTFGRSPSSRVRTKSKLSSTMDESQDMIFNNYIRDTNVLNFEPENWDWDMITNVLCYPSDSFKRMDEDLFKRFCRRLIVFLKPNSKQYSCMDSSDPKGRLVTSSCCHLLSFLEEVDESRSFEYLQEFLLDLSESFSQVINDNAPQSSLLSPTRLLSTLSQYYFLFIGIMSDSSKGKKLLERMGIYQQLLDLTSISAHEIYLKLIVSSLDYTKDRSFCRTLLTKALTSTSEASRIYTTNYLRVLLRAGMSDFRWAVDLLVPQLFDESPVVSLAAFSVLDEACDHEPNLEALVRIRPSLVHSGHSGILLMTRFFSTPSGFKMMQDKSVITHQMQEWKECFCLKYVKIVESLLNETLTYHFMSDDGTYGRRSDKQTGDKNCFLPPHFYGQLVRHEEGISYLRNDPSLIQTLCSVIKRTDLSTELSRLELKAALWSVGHICTTPAGFSLMSPTPVIQDTVSLTANCPFLSIRGTGFYALGLIASTDVGSDRLHEYGWESIRHGRCEKWPVVRVSDDTIRRLQEELTEAKIKSDSISSSGLTDISEHASERSILQQKVVVPNVPTSVYGSLPPEYVLCPHPTTSSPATAGVLKEASHPERPRSSSDVPSSVKLALKNQESESDLASCLTIGTPEPKSDSEKGEDVFLPSAGKIDSGPKRKASGRHEVKSRSGSYTNDSSGVGSFASLTGAIGGYVAPKNHPKLSPIASISSTGSFLGFSSHASLMNHSHNMNRQSSSQASPEVSLDSLNAADVQGYAVFIAIQRQRVLSLGHSGADNRMIHSSSGSSSENEDSEFNRSFHSSAGFRFRDQPSGIPSTIHSSADAPFGDPSPVYMGLSIPVCLSLIFNPPQASRDTKVYRVSTSESESGCQMRHETSNANFISGLEFHNSNNCLLCFKIHPVRPPTISFTATEECTSGDDQQLETITHDSASGIIPHAMKSVLEVDISSSITSTSSVEGGSQKPVLDQAMSQILIRKEVLRFVTSLSGSVAAKAAEQGLLNLKQRFPHGFQDICLYSEVCLQMAAYNFRLPSRRFLQELFLDLNFDQLKTYAENILSSKKS